MVGWWWDGGGLFKSSEGCVEDEVGNVGSMGGEWHLLSHGTFSAPHSCVTSADRGLFLRAASGFWKVVPDSFDDWPAFAHKRAYGQPYSGPA